MKKVIKKTAKKVAPNFSKSLREFKNLPAQVENLNSSLLDLSKRIESLDTPYVNGIVKLKNMLESVEQYQPIYGLPGLVNDAKRDSKDRCDTILHQAFDGDVRGMRILDVGSSLGYVSFYFADRGAIVEGWEAADVNIVVAKEAKKCNGVDVNFLLREANPETVRNIPASSYDAVFILSLVHHFVYSFGIEKTKKMLQDILDKIPVLIIEFALKGEDKKLWWDSAQPEDPLELIEGLDVTIEKIDEFSTHLSEKKRPLYKISKKNVVVNNRAYPFELHRRWAYKNSKLTGRGDIPRDFYLSTEYFIKQYRFTDEGSHEENRALILNEIAFYLMTKREGKHVYGAPEFIDYEVGNTQAKIVLKAIGGVLLEDEWGSLNKLQTWGVVRDVLKSLSDLESIGYRHNDIRSWNVMYDKSKGKAHLIDFGTVSPIESEKNNFAFLRFVKALLCATREDPTEDLEVSVTKSAFKGTGYEDLFACLSKEKYSFNTGLLLLEKEASSKKHNLNN